MNRPRVDEMDAAVAAMREWQIQGAPMQLHPGDIAWYRQLGAETAAAAVRTWSRDGRLLAVGLLDGPDVLRMTTAPDARQDRELAERVVADVVDPDRGVLPEGAVNVEAPMDSLLQELLPEHGWVSEDPWTPLRRDLADPVEDPGLRIAVTDEALAPVQTAVHRSAFGSPGFTVERWRNMAAGPMFADARCLLAYDADGEAVATATVWSAGPGRPGLIEPMGVHADHRGKGHGRAMNLAAAAALREMGASSVIVCTPSSNPGGVAAYASAGFRILPEVRDLCRKD
nr:GNAT family N-acetyltransferase [Glycomyces paridis]